MLNAVALKFPAAKRQRCSKHKLANVLSYVPQSKRAELEPELKAIFYQDSRAQAEQTWAAFIAKDATTYPSAIECLQRDQAACLTFYDFPKAHWKTIRTTNVIEIVLMQLTKGGLFPFGVRRNDVANLHLAVGDDDSINEQFYQLPPLVKGEVGQGRFNPLAKSFDPPGESSHIDLLLDLHLQLAQLLRQAPLCLVEFAPFALEFVTPDNPSQVDVEQPGLLPLELRDGVLERSAPRLEHLR